MRQSSIMICCCALFWISCESDSSDSGDPDQNAAEFSTAVIFSRGNYHAVGLTFDGIASDSKNNIHIIHESDELELLYTTNKTGIWETTVIEKVGIEIGKYASIAVDSQDFVHVAYFVNTKYEQLGEAQLIYGDLKYATHKSGTWQTTTIIIGAGMTPRIFVDEQDRIHIVHSKLGVSDLFSLLDILYTTNSSGSWETTAMKSGTVKGADASVAVDSAGHIHISCRNEEGTGTSAEGGQGGLRYITNVSGAWTWYDVDPSASAGNDGDIALDSEGYVHISYLDKNKGLKYATNASGAWSFMLLDETPNVGWNTSIQADADNKIHVSYSDPGVILTPPGNGYLMYATNETGEWQITTVDTENAGYSTGLTVSDNNQVHIAYYVFEAPVVRGELKYATKPTLAGTRASTAMNWTSR